jgi:hypothetical protein
LLRRDYREKHSRARTAGLVESAGQCRSDSREETQMSRGHALMCLALPLALGCSGGGTSNNGGPASGGSTSNNGGATI